MKTTFSLFCVLALATFVSCSKDVITGSGEIISETRDVGPFNKVRSDGVFVVTITHGDLQSVEILADNNILGKVRTVVSGDELKLYLDDDYNYGEVHLRANITVPRLDGLKNIGAGELHAFGIDETGRFDLLNSGSGSVTMEGSAGSLHVFNEGSGDIKAFDFKVLQCDATMVGSGDLEINCADALRVSIEGTGNIYYLGNPVIEATIEGSGQVINAN